jgi:nitroreductase
VLREILDDARFAPNGGNRQPWRVVCVEDPALRRRLRDLYVDAWLEYLALRRGGLVPFAVTNDPDCEGRLLASAIEDPPDPGGFARNLDTVPALLVVLADLPVIAAVDKDLDRYSIAGGASVYPFAHNILLAARSRGLGGVLTTVLSRREEEVLAAVGATKYLALAAVLALGYPLEPAPTRLRRSSVEEFTTIDRIDGPPLG